MSLSNLKQPQREAILDLLVLAMSIDKKFSLKEEDRLAEILEQMGWESHYARDLFVLKSITKARQVEDNADKLHDYMLEQAQLLDSSELALEIYGLISEFVAVDETNATESSFLKQLKNAVTI